MEWISVKDKLPAHDQKVLAVFDTKDSDWYKYPTNLRLLNFYDNGQFDRHFRDGSTLLEVRSENITHWMSLPLPPKK